LASEKTKLLKTAFDRVIAVSLIDMNAPLRWINQYFADTVTGFGTAEDEKINTLEEIRHLILNGRKQSKKFSFFKVNKLTPFNPRYSSDSIAVLTDEFALKAKLGDEKIEMHLFFTSVFQYDGHKWKCIAFHGSFPPKNSSTEDTFHAEENKKRLLELEQRVEERTAELIHKNKELQIEAAIERVRTVAMAMNKPEDMQEICKTIAEELGGLSVKNISLVETIEIDQDKAVFYDYEFYPKSNHKSFSIFNYKNNKQLKTFAETILANEDNFYYSGKMRGVSFTKWINYLKTVPAYIEPEWLQHKELHFYFQSAGIAALGFVSTMALTKYEISILKRFRNVFYLAYKRFADIKFAKAQAREAEIQLSLERIRNKTIAMKNSTDVGDAVLSMYTELTNLGDKSIRSGILIIKEDVTMDVWTAHQNGSMVIGKVDMKIHRLLLSLFDAWKKREKYFVYGIAGKEQKRYFEAINSSPAYPVKYDLSKLPSSMFCNCYFFYGGGIFTWGEYPVSEELNNIFFRFTDVFGQTYKRYNDLKLAEAQAREAEIQLSLEKVRAATNSMQSTKNLLGIIKIVSEQIEGLGIRFTHVNFRTTEGEDDWDLWSHFKWLGSPVRWRVQYFDHPIFNRSRNNPNYLVHQDVFTLDEKISFESKLVELQLLPNPSGTEENLAIKKYIEESTGFAWAVYRMDHLSLAIANNKGTHYTDEEQQILQRFAEVFNQSYTRFLDLQKAEAQAIQAELDLIAIKEAKQKAEQTLAELQATQKQLVQAEKLASLGELTAGIAHEIQNPLNFVNNFSEVSAELVDEMKSEIKKGNYDEVYALVDDVKQNLEKINHHGQRAADIVKGMLQHSRSSNGVKEPTDINALADEYLRLAFHGLRAKDKGFNATMKTDLDEKIGKINVIPQDIGRVILNLITNGFYVVNEKSKQGITNYEPTVSVSTKRVNSHVEIKVADNGNGIPPNILDKIFQPFFTTKPTGQGTGLGLSLSYDIVKAHGGELRVETKEGIGSEFIIQFPIV
jgi:signal transduction histidine kinase